uniref:Proline dehydrogenase n=1 Tax=Sinocyclocheilus grahami TaxID=75366 RepID=A0A672PNX4_SINGR
IATRSTGIFPLSRLPNFINMSYCKVIPASDDAPLDPSCAVVEKPCEVDLISRKAHTERQRISIDFDNTQEAYKSKDTLELLRSLLVFKLCTFDFLVDKNKELMDLSKKVFGQQLFEKLMKMTFYGQFVAGEDQNTIKPLIEKNQAFGVGSVLDYSVEEDLTQEEAEKKEMDSTCCLSFLRSQMQTWFYVYAARFIIIHNYVPTGCNECLVYNGFSSHVCLFQHAVVNGVRLMVDAEQTYFQPAISRLTLEMQRIFNREKPNIFNTYQCYLREAYDNVSVDVELSRREGWYFGAKLVRGAYMCQERSRAAEIGYEDPINPDYETTNRMYHKCLEYILEEINHNRMANVMVASHNEDTVKFTLEKMNETSLSPTENKVCFGQLLGMCDQISFPLGQAGFPVYKYVPYGPVNEVIPYLSRRAQENRGFMKGSQRERSLLWKELKRRLFSGHLLYKPAY